MKILMITTHLNTGGISSYLMTLASGLVEEGDEVFLISSGGNMAKRFERAGVRVRHLDILTKSELSWKIYASLPDLRDYVRQHRIDIIHAHTRVSQVLGEWLSRMTGVPMVTTCHGFFKPRLGRKLFPCWGQRTIAISQAVKDHLIKDFRVLAGNIRLIESGIDLTGFPMIEEKLRKDHRRELGLGDEPIIGMVARLSDVKGQDVLIEAFARVNRKLPDAKLMIVGQGKEKEQLKSLARHFGLEKSILFLDDLDRTRFYLSVFDIFANPSRQEGLGLSIMEAQASGLPVVASNIGGIPTLIEHGKTGYLVPPQDPNALAKQLIEVLEHLPEARQVGQQARAFIESNYAQGRMIEETTQVYQDLSKKM